ncbi:LAFA_0E04654g1_1 [Lachancea sp. 'fantastica']|nr:LAFA_0E04654g1_1 [Lachancea sp. 'fantastica']
MSVEDQWIADRVEILRTGLFSAKKQDQDLLSLPQNSDDERTPKEVLEALSSGDAAGLKGEIVIKRLFLEAAKDNDETIKVGRFAILMDLSHHMKNTANKMGDDVNAKFWASIFFDLFRMSLTLLQLPQGHLQFWPYVNSRMHWFKAGFLNEDSLQHGQTTLSAIKAPFAKVTYQINKMLLALRLNSKLATCAHHELSMKINIFLCECLSPMEQANTNKRGKIAKKLPEQLWDMWNDEKEGSAFYTDFLKVKQEFIEEPIMWAFSDTGKRLSLQDYLLPVMDEILLHESEFYAHIKTRKVRLNRLNQKANVQSYQNLQALNNVQDIKRHKWSSTFSGLRPLMFDQPDWDSELVMSQLQDPSNDFHRKKFLLELLITANLIKRILSDETVKNFYRTQYDQPLGTKHSDEDGSNAAALQDITQIITSRIEKFYDHHDKTYRSLLTDLITGDGAFLDLKAKKGFKLFNEFTFPTDSEGPVPEVNYSYKGFGWIKLGNKKLDNVWKTKSGLGSIDYSLRSSQETFDQLRDDYQKRSFDTSTPTHGDQTVEQWKHLRRLRPQFLFQLSNVDENTGVSGLFDSSLIHKSREKKSRLPEQVEAAKEYFEAKKKRKVELSEEAAETVEEKQDICDTDKNLATGRPDDTTLMPTSVTLEPMHNGEETTTTTLPRSSSPRGGDQPIEQQESKDGIKDEPKNDICIEEPDTSQNDQGAPTIGKGEERLSGSDMEIEAPSPANL